MASEKWRKFVIIGLVIFSVILVLIGMLLGLRGLASFFKFLAISLLILTLFGGVVYIVYLIFFAKEYKDIPAQFKKKLMKTTKVMENDMLGDLYLTGDTKHNRIKLGKYLYLRVPLPKVVTEKNKENIDPTLRTQAVQVDCFIVARKGLISKIFPDHFFILVKPQDHDYSSIFNDVSLNGFNLVPLDNEFFTIDRRNLDLDMVKGLELNYIRELVYDIFKDLDRLVKQAMNLDQQFQKEKEKAREFEIPGNIGDLFGKK